MKRLYAIIRFLFTPADTQMCQLCFKHDIYGKDLIFISSINRDGSGTTPVSDKQLRHLDDELFHIGCLSLTAHTYIAMGFSSFVVKLKDDGFTL